MDEDSSVSVGDTATATDRFVGETAVLDDETDNNLLLRRPFTKPEDQFMVGEVYPREQEVKSVSGGTEMVLDHTPNPPTEVSSSQHTPNPPTEVSSSQHIPNPPTEVSSSKGAYQITEENDNAESQLVPSSGFNGNDRLQMVSKDWVLSQIENQVGKVRESNSQQISDLKDKMSQMEVKFDQQIKEKDKQLQCKQRELDQCQKELDGYKKQVQDLQEKLSQETETRAEVEQEKSDLEERMKRKEKKIRKLEKEIETLAEKAKTAEGNEQLFKEMTQHLLEEVRVQRAAPHTVSPGPRQPPSPEPAGTFQSLQGLHPYGWHSPDKMVFSPKPSIDEPSRHSDEDSVD